MERVDMVLYKSIGAFARTKTDSNPLSLIKKLSMAYKMGIEWKSSSRHSMLWSEIAAIKGSIGKDFILRFRHTKMAKILSGASSCSSKLHRELLISDETI